MADKPDFADQIRKLAELRDDGLLTQEEFDAKKAQVLGTSEAGQGGDAAAEETESSSEATSAESPEDSPQPAGTPTSPPAPATTPASAGAPPFLSSEYRFEVGSAIRQSPQSAKLALGLSVGGLLCFGLPAIGGLVVARNAKKEIRASQGALSGENVVTAAQVIGWIAIVLWSLSLIGNVGTYATRTTKPGAGAAKRTPGAAISPANECQAEFERVQATRQPGDATSMVPAVRACKSVAEWTTAAARYPSVIVTPPGQKVPNTPESFLTNMCQTSAQADLKDLPICKEALVAAQAKAEAAQAAQAAAQAKAEADQAAAQAKAEAAKSEPKGDGNWTVGVEIAAGKWRSQGTGSSCYWQRNPDGSPDKITDNHFGDAGGTVTVRNGEEFQTKGCGRWEKVG